MLVAPGRWDGADSDVMSPSSDCWRKGKVQGGASLGPVGVAGELR